ncbi:hypothetical protein ASG67_17820 [Sphingomonas sp. Leaf339]|uniref:DUF4450 domain-containing protein n=1 Tax=Sphingomonas sp. Leaf339 TaxID=1736343 RepID=UPI0006F7FE37|nr:DUF4450 domain-containing protein [Sphingomonas sp. Leaf339]KQU55188.1 hypothetical protein ASG67_17820 [Sphingomonas sp. Leaf339]
MTDHTGLRISRRTFIGSGSIAGLTTVIPVNAVLAEPQRVSPGALNSTLRYIPTPEGIVTRGGRRFGNRPLYGDHGPFTLMAGDRPLLRLMGPPRPLGVLLVGWRAGNRIAWLHDFAKIESTYSAGLMRWTARDPRFPDTIVELEALTLSGRDGAILRLTATGSLKAAETVLMHGALMNVNHPNLLWAADPGLHPSVQATASNHQNDGGIPPGLNELEEPFRPSNADGNRITLIDSHGFEASSTLTGAGTRLTTSRSGRFVACNADAWADPNALLESKPGTRPIGVGTVAMTSEPLFLAIEPTKPGAAPSGVPTAGSPTLAVAADKPMPTRLAPDALATAFGTAQARVAAIARRVVIRTPDAQLDAMLPAAAAVINATFYDPQIVHGAMAWNVPLIGWRSFYGSTCLGWHDRLLTVARYYLPTQKTSGPTAIRQDPRRRLSMPAEDSRFYGRGHVAKDQNFYNMQAVFFDQLIHAWHASGNTELERLLRPALDLHIEWMTDCFDPDGDGLYESFLDTWASDSMWYNGGATPYASAYACRACDTAALLAQRAGDVDAAIAHRAKATKIRTAIKDRLWNGARGCVGEYIEALGSRRRHDDTSLYSVAIPIDCGAVTADMALQMIDYTRWGLERVPLPAGGEQCYTSNFVPHVWSVREADTADTLHLALAAWQAGVDDDAWSLFQGGFRQSGFASATPGAIMCEPPGKKYASVDFSDSTNMFVRATIEGLFGYRADRAQGIVAITPRFPADWDHAALDHPDVGLSFERKDGVDVYTVVLPQPAQVTLAVPVRSIRKINSSSRQAGRLEAGIGAPRFVSASPGPVSRWSVEVPHDGNFAGTIGSDKEVQSGGREPLVLSAVGGRIVRFEDPQQVFQSAEIKKGVIVGSIRASVTGHHLVVAEVESGAARWRQMLRLNIKGATAPAQAIPPAEAWTAIPLALDADLSKIYSHKYLSPRPDAISAQIGDDGYSAWTATFWDVSAPPVGTALIPKNGRMTASNGVPFTLSPNSKNIAFTSFWDNWPTKRTFSVDRAGTSIALLLSGTTNQMQTGIANGQVILRYSDGVEERHDIHHPKDFWDVAGDYNYPIDGFSLPKTPPPTLQLDKGSRAVAMVLPLRSGCKLREVELETLSMEVIIGLMALSIA